MIDAALWLEVWDLYDAYVTALDDGDLDAWCGFFTADAFYEVIPRENFDRGLPLATLRCESRGMLRDRVLAIRKTQLHAPRYLRHLVSSVRVESSASGVIRSRANYCVLQTLVDEETKVFQAGRYVDVLVREDGRLLFQQRRCVFDSTLVPNSLIYPV